MKTIFLLFFLLNIPFTILCAQTVPAIEWQQTIGGSSSDELLSVIQTKDGGYLLGGYSGSDISGDKTENSEGDYDYWIVKLDSSGNISWQNTIGGDKTDALYSVIQTSDGGYLLGGISYSGISGDKTEECWISNYYGYCLQDYWILKLDSLGNIMWQNTIGGDDDEYFGSVIQTMDGGYLVGGHSYSGISGDKTEAGFGDGDYWIVKLDGSGNITWQRTIGGNDGDQIGSVIQTTDGGYFLGGASWSGISGDKTEGSLGNKDYWVIKLDSSGNITWQNTIGGNNWDHLYSYSTIQTSDGGYLLGGVSNSDSSGDKIENNVGGRDYWIIKLDTSGNITWQNSIGGSDYEELHSVIQTKEGGYLLSGFSQSGISGDKTIDCWEDIIYTGFCSDDYWIIKLDSYGNIIWQKIIGGTSGDYLYSVIQTTDEGYLLGGKSKSGISGNKTENTLGSTDYWVVKLTGDSSIIFTDVSEKKHFFFSIFPNPNDGKITITANLVQSESLTIKVLELTGRELHLENIGNVNGIFTQQLDLSNFSSGTYLFQFISNGQCAVKKLVIQK